MLWLSWTNLWEVNWSVSNGFMLQFWSGNVVKKLKCPWVDRYFNKPNRPCIWRSCIVGKLINTAGLLTNSGGQGGQPPPPFDCVLTPGTSAPSTMDLTVFLCLCISLSNASGKFEGPWRAPYQNKKPINGLRPRRWSCSEEWMKIGWPNERSLSFTYFLAPWNW